MTKITRRTRGHNHTRWAAILVVTVAASLLAACGGGNDDQAADEAPGHTYLAKNCALVVTDHALNDFYAMADRVAAEEAPLLDDYVALTADPVWDRWRRSFEFNIPSDVNLARNIFIAQVGRDKLPPRLRDKPYRVDMVRNYEVNLDLRPEVEAFVARFVAEEYACGIGAHLEGWLAREQLPDTLRIDFLVGNPEIRLYEDHFMVDGSLAFAAGREQLVRFLATMLYRDRSLVPGLAPNEAHGPDILLNSLRIVRNEAVPAYIDEFERITFDPRHPILGPSAAVPDELCGQAERTIRSLDRGLTRVLAKTDPTDEDWRVLYRLFVGAQSWQPTGWYMARVIVDQLGEPALQTAQHTVADFFAAYQEACAQLPAQPTAPQGSLAWYLQAAPAFSTANAMWLDEQLRRAFP